MPRKKDVASASTASKTHRKALGLEDLKGFIKTWEGADSLAEAAELAGMEVKSAQTLAARLRKMDVPLKHMVPQNGYLQHSEALQEFFQSL